MADQKHLDPVCGMTVEESPTALSLDYKEATYYFAALAAAARSRRIQNSI